MPLVLPLPLVLVLGSTLAKVDATFLIPIELLLGHRVVRVEGEDRSELGNVSLQHTRHEPEATLGEVEVKRNKTVRRREGPGGGVLLRGTHEDAHLPPP